MKCFSLPTTRFRRRICLILVPVVILTFINLLLCTWKVISWEDEEFEFNIVELTHLGKRRTYKHILFTKAVLQPKATQETLHRPSLQRWTNQETPKPTTPRATPQSTAWARMEKSSSPVYNTRLRKQVRTPSIEEVERVTLKIQTVPAQKGVNRTAKAPSSQADHDHAHISLSQVTLQNYIELQNTKAKQYRDSKTPVQVFHSEQEAVRACELAGEYCQGISKLNEETTFVYALESYLNLITDHTNSTLYVKAKFVTNLEYSDNEVSCGVVPSKRKSPNSTDVGCRLPDIDPFDKNAMLYFLKVAPMSCEREAVLFTRYRDGSLEVVLNHDRGAPLRRISFQTIHRTNGSDWGFSLGVSTLLKYRGPITKVNHDFIRINAEFANGMMQNDFHAQVIPKPAVLKRKPRHRAGLPLNIIILGLDQTSQATFQRLLPDSYKFLRDELQAFMFKGFSLVGEATTPQLTALLTGRTVEENCKRHEARTGFDGAGTLDKWPFIFKTFKKYGYATLFSEDAPPVGAFNMRLTGFNEPPSDHYARPFWTAVPHGPDSGLHDKCVNSQPQHKLQLEYLKSMFRAYPKTPKFGFTFLSSLCHHITIMPLGAAAPDFFEFFKSIRDSGFLNDTMFVVMGDHGARTGEFRSTIQGKLEERLPFLSIALPASFRQKYPQLVKNLEQNTKIIITPLDLHATFMHVLKYPRDPSKSELTWGTSLFSSIPRNRTCQDAKIPEYFCPCVQWLPLNVTHAHVRIGALRAADYINSLLAEDSRVRRLCAKLTLYEILSAWQEMPSVKVRTFSGIENGIGLGFGKADFESSQSPNECSYQVKFRTKPGYGIFEASVKVIDGHFIVNKHISRINIYGSQPDCIKTTYPQLRKFCYCGHDI
ncbi:uncharacterized protein LOC144634923 [Oculina patagonica]